MVNKGVDWPALDIPNLSRGVIVSSKDLPAGGFFSVQRLIWQIEQTSNKVSLPQTAYLNSSFQGWS